MDTVGSIRNWFATLYGGKNFVTDKTGVSVIEILGAQFVADEPFIFGSPNDDYIRRELAWYNSTSLNINDMEPPVPKIWKQIATTDGWINSNYGHLVFSEANGHQYNNVVKELIRNPFSRRAEMIYIRPSMWDEYDREGMSDFICTNTVQYFIRQNPAEKDVDRLFAYVNMRSCDAWLGYRNDVAWQRYVLEKLYYELNVKLYRDVEKVGRDRVLKRGSIIWNVGSLHLYERNFKLVKHYIETGNPEGPFSGKGSQNGGA